jgi:squalene-associated FAD-dependent desaturase
MNLVIGGGLAGLAAACALAEHGRPVTLIEQRPFVGGKTWSFCDEMTGTEVDNGQHVFLGCCSEYKAFLARLGVADRVSEQRRLRVPILDPKYGPALLAGDPLPAPFHLLRSFWRLPFLSWREKLLAMQALLLIKLGGEGARQALDNYSFYDWLKAHQQSEHAIAHLWDLIILPTLNDRSRDVSAGLAFMVFQEGFLRTARGANVGYARVGLSQLVADAACNYLQAHGGQIILGRRAIAVLIEQSRAQGVRLVDGSVLDAATVTLAVPHYHLASLLPPVWQKHPFFARAAYLGVSPIVGVNLWFDRSVFEEEFAAVVGRRDTYWVFNRSAILQAKRGDGQYLTVSISGAHDWIRQSQDAIISTVREELASVLPKLKAARLIHARVIKEKQATFAAAPGSLRYRLPCRTPIANLFLAGSWTDTGWPATMEGAVRSGLACAAAVSSCQMAG